jgi:hypothetical protein
VAAEERGRLLGRGRQLEVFTLLWNSAEGVAGVLLGLLAGSIALVGSERKPTSRCASERQQIARGLQ